MATKMKTELYIARFRWLSVFNSVRYKDEEDKLNHKIDLNMRYMVANTDLNIAKEVANEAAGITVSRNNYYVAVPNKEQDRLFAKTAKDKIPELEIAVRNLYRELRVAYLNDNIDWNNISISLENRVRILNRLGLEGFNI